MSSSVMNVLNLEVPQSSQLAPPPLTLSPSPSPSLSPPQHQQQSQQQQPQQQSQQQQQQQTTTTIVPQFSGSSSGISVSQIRIISNPSSSSSASTSTSTSTSNSSTNTSSTNVPTIVVPTSVPISASSSSNSVNNNHNNNNHNHNHNNNRATATTTTTTTASTLVFVQDLVNEVMSNVAAVSAAAAAAAVAASSSGVAGNSNNNNSSSSSSGSSSSGGEDSNPSPSPPLSQSSSIINDNNPTTGGSSSSVIAKRSLDGRAGRDGAKSSKRCKKSGANSHPGGPYANQSMLGGAGGAATYGVPGSGGAMKLEQRLGGILCCAVCLDLPKSSVYQCTNGHLMCAGCFTHLLADARIRDETATCPNCRCVISKDACSRNLAVEKAVCELPGECRFCNQELPRSLLDRHMTEQCEERNVTCRYVTIGCPWNGPFHEADFHAETCQHPSKSGAAVLAYLHTQEKCAKEERKLFDSLFGLLSFEKITLNDLQFRPFRTDEYIHKLFYETARFSAFSLQWVVKARVNDDQRDPTQSCDRQLSFQIALKSKLATPMTIHYMILRGPFGDMKALPKLFKHDFAEQSLETAYQRINLINSAECNRLLAAKVINFRLIMFQASK